MVHSWVITSSSVGYSVHKPAPLKSGCIAERQASRAFNWKLARGLFFLFAFLILFSGLALMHTFASSGEVAPATSQEIIISVDSGDTLWELARTYKKDSMDTRQAIHMIVDRNGLASSDVKSGQSLIIPARILR